MKSVIASIFGQSPFVLLQRHMEKVELCIEKLKELMASVESYPEKKIHQLVQEICDIESDADEIKNDIRNHLPRTLFLAIDRVKLLDILAQQDAIADAVEDIALLVKLGPLQDFEKLRKPFLELMQESLQTFGLARQIMKEFDQLLESTFGGWEATRIKECVLETAFKEDDTKKVLQHVMEELFCQGKQFSAPAFYQWVGMIELMAKIAALSEGLANRVRMTLETK